MTFAHANLFSVAIGFGWLVIFYELVIHELKCELQTEFC